MADNASNNDTLVQSLESRFHAESIPFVASDARMRCLPHTIHLVAMEVSACIFFRLAFMMLTANLPDP